MKKIFFTISLIFVSAFSFSQQFIKIDTLPQIKNDEKMYDINGVDVKPDFPGGFEELYEYFSENINYPKYERNHDISGIVYVQFEIDKEGKIRDVQIVRSLSKNIDEEAIRIVKNMTDWKPGIHNGRKVRVKYILPIRFSLVRL